MVTLIFGFSLVVLAYLMLVLIATYQELPIIELKRRARQGDVKAKSIFRAVAYGSNLTILLWTIALLAMAGGLSLFAISLPAWLSYIVAVSILGLLVFWVRVTPVNGFSRQITIWLTPVVTAVLHYLFPLLQRISLRKHVYGHTGLYENDDLVQLLDQQQQQPDNRIPTNDLRVMAQVLSNNTKKAGDIKVPFDKIVSVFSKDTIGPVLMDQLHKSGHACFPVVEEKSRSVVGVVYLSELLAASQGGKVSDFMHKGAVYLHEDFSMSDVLQAFYKTKQYLFMVVNSLSEYVGMLTLADVIRQVLGKPDLDDFSAYEDLSAVALKGLPEPVLVTADDYPIENLEENTDGVSPKEMIE